MKSIKHIFLTRVKNLAERPRYDLFKAVFLSMAAAIISSISPFLEGAGFDETILSRQEKLLYFLSIILIVLIISTILTLIIKVFRNKTKQAARIRAVVAEAFTGALDKSSFNPKNGRRLLDESNLPDTAK